jgi:hypothetical protein
VVFKTWMIDEGAEGGRSAGWPGQAGKSEDMREIERSATL